MHNSSSMTTCPVLYQKFLVNPPTSYLRWTGTRIFFIFLLVQKRFNCAFGPFVGTVRPLNLLLRRPFVGCFYFTSFYKLAHPLSLNLTEWQLLRFFRFYFGGIQFLFLGTFGVASASLATTAKCTDRTRGAH